MRAQPSVVSMRLYRFDDPHNRTLPESGLSSPLSRTTSNSGYNTLFASGDSVCGTSGFSDVVCSRRHLSGLSTLLEKSDVEKLKKYLEFPLMFPASRDHFRLQYCYGHIVMVIRQQMRVMAGHNVEGWAQSTSQAQSRRVKWNVIKKMIIVSAFFIICSCPLNVCVISVASISQSSEITNGYTITLLLTYVNVSLNPFIYATKHEGVRRILASVIVRRKHDDSENVRTEWSYDKDDEEDHNKCLVYMVAK